MKGLILLCLCFLQLPLLQGQQRVIDSLKKILPLTNDTLRLVHAKLLNEAYNEINTDSAVAYALQYGQLSQKLNYKINYADALRRIAASTDGNSASDLDSLFKAEKLLEVEKNENLLPLTYLQVLGVATEINSYNKYRQYMLGNIYLNLGLSYWGNAKYKTAILYFNQALKIGKEIKNPDLLGDAYLTIGVNTSNDDSTLNYLLKAYNLAFENRFYNKLGLIEDFLAKEYRYLEDYTNQLKYLRASLHHHQEQGKLANTGWAYIGLGEYYQKNIPNYDSSLWYLHRAFNVSQTVKANQPSIEYWSSRYLYEVYLALGIKDSALKYVGIMLKARDIVFNEDKIHEFETTDYLERKQRADQESANAAYRSSVKAYSLLAGLLVFIVLAYIFWRNNKRRQREYSILQKQKAKTEETLQNLKLTQQQLIQSEKMASLGELTAGIAHEIQNPLNFVNNFSEVSQELFDEIRVEFRNGNFNEAWQIGEELVENLQKINHHGKRADAIVKGMLQHSRKSEGKKEPTDINTLCDEYLRLSYHGLRAKDKSFNATLKTDFDESIGKINIVPHDIGRVLLNLFNNAFYAVNEKQKAAVEDFKPTVSVSTKKINGQIEIIVQDNGNGIPESIKEKIFQPFFTTKPTGQGTGLGLSLSYDIIKAHDGKLQVETKEGEGSEFTISLTV